MRRLPIDALRGFVIALMALDHTQFFWSIAGLPDDGLAGYIPVYASPAHQITRALSHVCAPTFLFLAGMMMAGKSDRGHLVKRALLLILLQFTLENVAWWPAAYVSAGYRYFGILACIGVSMLIVIALSKLGARAVLAASIAAIAAAQLVGASVPAGGRWMQGIAIVLYVPSLAPDYPMTSLFPVLHWVGFLGVGYWFGTQTLARELSLYKSRLAATGLGLIVAASALRLANGLGNRIHWKGGWKGGPFSSDFYILSKYPPSLVYVLVTLGATLTLLAIAIHFEARLSSRLARPLVVFGQTSLFFYLVHLYLYGAVAYAIGRNVQVDLARTWEAWLVGLILLYGLCDSYRAFKARNEIPLLRYI